MLMVARSPMASVAVLGAIAVLLATLAREPAGTATPEAPRAEPARRRAPAAEGQNQGGGKVRELVQAYFGCESGKLDDELATCSLDAVIATVPDPLASRVDWAFDQHL